MSYCDEAAVKSEFKNLEISASTMVSTADVASFITQTDALINSFIGARYILPIPAGEGLELLKFIAVSIIADRIRAIMEVKQPSSKDAVQNVRRLLDAKTALEMLKNLKDGKQSLIGADLATSGGGLYSENAANNVKPYFKKDKVQW